MNCAPAMIPSISGIAINEISNLRRDNVIGA
jgi:hypothetical protein